MIDCIKAKYNQDQTCLLHSVVIHGSNKQIMLHIKNVTNKIAAYVYSFNVAPIDMLRS